MGKKGKVLAEINSGVQLHNRVTIIYFLKELGKKDVFNDSI